MNTASSFSNKLSFTVTSLGYSKKVIYRNKALLNDDIYVTGNLGDSFMGLQILKNKIKVSKKLKNYFVQKYYLPDIQIELTKRLLNIANSSIDLSDGLIDDLCKMINNHLLCITLIAYRGAPAPGPQDPSRGQFVLLILVN